MKFSKLFFAFVIASATLVSCSKDDDAKGIAGTWEGKWGFDEDTPTYYEKWEMKKNGEMKVYDDDGLYAEGTFTVDGLNFTATYTPVGKNYSYIFTGLYHDELGEITGNWGEAPSTTDGGTFEMYKN